MNNDMKHMDHIETVARNDVRTLQEKESTYQGSWKRAGGRSAWFMARRNMDRLITMLAAPKEPDAGFNLANVDDTVRAFMAGGKMPGSPEATGDMLRYLRDSFIAEDIFRAIEADPSGSDGTVLACVRDLRCYFMLIEAEMMSRGVIPVNVTASGEPSGRTVSVLVHDDLPKPRTPEDGGQHANLIPYVVKENFFASRSIPDRLVSAFWRQIGAKHHAKYVLEAAVESAKLPRCLVGIYGMGRGNLWVIKIENVPEDAREYYPRLRREKNSMEYDSLPQWQQAFYVWVEDSNKFVLSPEFSGWAVED